MPLALAVVVGNRRPFLAAIIVLNTEAWRLFAASKSLDPQQPNHAASKIEVLARITSLLVALPR
jgi:long-subunit acyl-CoA synthetase (AMP-forming)